MKALRFTLVVIAAVAALGSCSLFFNIFNSGPDVYLSAPDTTLTSGQIVTLAANVSDGDGLVTYKWYEDGVDLGISTSNYSYSRFVTSDRTVTISVQVTVDGKSDTDSIDLYVSADSNPASIVFENLSSYDIYYVYVSPHLNVSWGPDQLRFYPAIDWGGGTWTLYGVPAGTWDLKAVSQDLLHTWTLDDPGEVVVGGNEYTWSLTDLNQD